MRSRVAKSNEQQMKITASIAAMKNGIIDVVVVAGLTNSVDKVLEIESERKERDTNNCLSFH
jgi:hypothetical protein